MRSQAERAQVFAEAASIDAVVLLVHVDFCDGDVVQPDEIHGSNLGVVLIPYLEDFLDEFSH